MFHYVTLHFLYYVIKPIGAPVAPWVKRWPGYIMFHYVTLHFLYYVIKPIGAPVAPWVKRWPTDLAVPISRPTRDDIFSTVNGVPLHTAFHYYPLIVLIWLKYCWKGGKIASHPSSILLHQSIVWSYTYIKNRLPIRVDAAQTRKTKPFIIDIVAE